MAFVWGYAPNGRDMGVGIEATYSVPGGGPITWQTASVDVTFQINYFTTYSTSDTYNVLHWWGAASGSAENTFYWSTARTAPRDGVGLRTVTVTVPLKTGESQYISLGARLEGVNTAGGNMSVTAGITIPARPYGTSDASINVSTATLGSTSVVVTITKKASQMRHTVYWRIGSGSWNVIAQNVDTSYTWTPPLTIANNITNATSADAVILVETYENGQYVGGVTKTLTFFVPISVVPTAGTFVASEGNSSVATIMGTSTTAETKTYVQGQSSVKLTYSGEAGSYGSTIARVEFFMNGSSVVNIGSGAKTSAFTGSPASDISITKIVTDSRGRTASTNLSGYYVRAYKSPKIASFSVVRAIDAAGTEGNSGVYAKAKLSASGSSLLNGTTEKNTLTWRLRSRVAGSYTWESDKWAGSDSTADASKLLTPPTSYVIPLATGTYQTTNAYEFEIAVWDKFTVSNPSISLYSMSTEIVPLSIAKGGIGVGKIWEEGALDVSGNTLINGNLTVSGNILPPVPTIPNVANLNTYTTAGHYVQTTNSGAQNGTNYPEAAAGWLEVVYGDPNWIMQRYTVYGYYGNKTYVRDNYGGWKKWQLIGGGSIMGRMDATPGFKSTTTSDTNITMANTFSMGGITFVSTNGGSLKVAESGYYEIHAQVYFTGSASGYANMRITRWVGSTPTNIVNTLATKNDGLDKTASASIIAQLNANNLISLRAASGTPNCSVYGDPDKSTTYLTLRMIDRI